MNLLEKKGWARLASRIEMEILYRAGVKMACGSSSDHTKLVNNGIGLYVEQTYGPAWALALLRDSDISFNGPFAASREVEKAKVDMEYRLSRLAVIKLTCQAPAIVWLASKALEMGGEAR